MRGLTQKSFWQRLLSLIVSLFNSGVKPVSLLADPQYVRAWPGGSGFVKMGSNYAPTLYAQQQAESLGCQQCLWLFGPNEEITEVGTMNIFVLMRKESAGQSEGTCGVILRVLVFCISFIVLKL